jgi:hypothetical protein
LRIEDRGKIKLWDPLNSEGETMHCVHGTLKSEDEERKEKGTRRRVIAGGKQGEVVETWEQMTGRLELSLGNN